jgi:NitT/TauT family transport system substrate-binding protein
MHRKMAVGIAALALGLAACGGGAGSAGSQGGSASGSATAITVGYVPYSDDDALFLAKENGFFARHGLNVTLTPQANPIAVVSSMVSGQEQFGFITTPVLINVNAKGTSLKCVSTVDGQQPAAPAPDATALVAAKGSGITSIAGLAGKKVATVQLSSLNSLSVWVLAKQAGISPKSIQLIQMPFPQMPAALSQGRVQAAVIVAPFVNTALAQGATVLDHPNQVLYPHGTVTCMGALGSYISKNPRIVTAFHAAMNEAVAYAKAHQAAAKAVLAKYLTGLTPAVAQKQILSTDWDPVLNAATVSQIEGYMKEFGIVHTTVPAANMIWAPAMKPAM